MEARHEMIPFDTDSPIRLFMHKLGDVSRHWHESLELLFVLAGEVSVFTGDRRHMLKAEDMLLVNSNTVHELHSESCVLIAVQIKLSKFNLSPDLLQSLYFSCSSVDAPDPEAFTTIKRIITALLQVSAAEREDKLFRNRTLAYELLSELVKNFRAEKPLAETNTQKHLERLNRILRYIGEHYREQLSLMELAEAEHLSVPYLSSFFEKYMGINYSAYYTNLRLEHALRELIFSDEPVEQIALASGFSDSRTFARAFKKRYNTTPSLYRKNASSPTVFNEADPLLAINYLDFKPENYLHILSRYLPDVKNSPLSVSQPQSRKLNIGPVSASTVKSHLRHTWKTMIGVGRCKELLYGEVQEMLRQLQKDIGFRYIRFHGIFSDDMLLCRTGKDGAYQFSFTQIDKALDFLLSVGLKPVIQFSFMPSAMASESGRQIFASPFTISPPRKMSDWNSLIRLFLSHIRERYGADEIRSWLYSPWNEPDTSPEMFGFDRPEQFYELYENSYATLKSFDPTLVIGSPSLFPLTPASRVWMSDFLRFTRERGCVPQCINVHYYSDNFHTTPPEESSFTTPSAHNADPKHFGKFLTLVRELLAEQALEDLPLMVSEWNLTVSHRNLINDTCFKAAYLTKNFLENYDRAEAFSYWSLTDFIEEYQTPEELFHGGMGLFTANGIKKPPYYAMTILSKLGDSLIDSGDGWFITRQGEKITMILYNYEHFNPLLAEGGLGLSHTKREAALGEGRSLDVELNLEGLPEGLYRLRETILNTSHGSCFDKWVETGGRRLGKEDIEWLKTASCPMLHISESSANGGALPYSASLAPQEVRLVEIIREDKGYWN